MSSPDGPDAFWWCPEIGVHAPQRVRTTERRTFSREDIDDPWVSRDGVTFWRLGHTWAVTNGSASMSDVYLWDEITGRRQVPTGGTIEVRERATWILLPSSTGAESPHIVFLSVPVARRAGSRRSNRRATDDRATTGTGLPTGRALALAIDRAGAEIRKPAVRGPVAAYAWPYFAVTTEPLAPSRAQTVATCATISVKQAERVMRDLRTAIWRTAGGQDGAMIFDLLVDEGLVRLADVAAGRHDHARCGHRPEILGPPRESRP